MKNNLLKTLFAGAFLSMIFPLTASADVEINETNFPDENFRSYLLSQDYGKDGVITKEEIETINIIAVFGKDISSLKGIEHFTALQWLDCMGNQLTTLDVSNCTALEKLDCMSNQLTTLDVSGCTALLTLECNNNQLTTLDVSGCTALTHLDCMGNQLTTLNVSDYTALIYLNCMANQLTALDVSGCTALTHLECYGNQLTALDVSSNTALDFFECSNNQLTALDVSGCTALTVLDCMSNQLTALDVSGCIALTVLSCVDNQLTALDVSGCTALQMLYCYDNQLTSLDVSNSTALTQLDCYSNQIKNEAMDALISSLPETTAGVLHVFYENADSEGNVITKSQVSAAKAKGWVPYYTQNGIQWLEYEGSDETVTDIALPEIENGTAPVYTLHGQKVTAPQKGGIYIINGHKVVIK